MGVSLVRDQTERRLVKDASQRRGKTHLEAKKDGLTSKRERRQEHREYKNKLDTECNEESVGLDKSFQRLLDSERCYWFTRRSMIPLVQNTDLNWRFTQSYPL